MTEEERAKNARNDLDALKLQREIPDEAEDELLEALIELYKLYDEGDPHPARRAVEIINKYPIKVD